MTFNKAAIDVLVKGLDPKHPHKIIGSDGLLEVPQKLQKEVAKETTTVFSNLENIEVKVNNENSKVIEIPIQELSTTEIIPTLEEPTANLIEIVETKSIEEIKPEILSNEEKPKRRGPPPRKKINSNE